MESRALLSCINTNNLWNNTDDTAYVISPVLSPMLTSSPPNPHPILTLSSHRYVGVGQQSASEQEILGAREILAQSIACAEATADPGSDCSLSYNCTSWRSMCGIPSLNASSLPDQW